MGKNVTVQVRMDADVKEKAELLYKRLGTTLEDAIRMFAVQSLEDNALPLALYKNKSCERIGIAAGEINVPDDIDFCNDEIESLFTT